MCRLFFNGFIIILVVFPEILNEITENMKTVECIEHRNQVLEQNCIKKIHRKKLSNLKLNRNIVINKFIAIQTKLNV